MHACMQELSYDHVSLVLEWHIRRQMLTTSIPYIYNIYIIYTQNHTADYARE